MHCSIFRLDSHPSHPPSLHIIERTPLASFRLKKRDPALGSFTVSASKIPGEHPGPRPSLLLPHPQLTHPSVFENPAIHHYFRCEHNLVEEKSSRRTSTGKTYQLLAAPQTSRLKHPRKTSIRRRTRGTRQLFYTFPLSTPDCHDARPLNSQYRHSNDLRTYLHLPHFAAFDGLSCLAKVLGPG